MAAARLVRRRLLDPREAGDAAKRPIPQTVNIPFSELPQRVHELPPRSQEVGVVGPGRLAHEVVAWLTSNGRRAAVVEQFAPQGPARENEIGRLWEPNPFLCEILPHLSGRSALELACGTGRDAVFMSACGWDVTAVDALPDALSRARELAAHCAPALRPIRWLDLDLETAAPEFAPAFDLIAVFRYLHRPLFAWFGNWLRPGGSVLYETFTTVHRQRYGRPARDAHVLQPGELPELLGGFEVRHHVEGWHGRAHTARVWATRP